VRILSPETPRVPSEGSSAKGQSGPKARPQGVADGKRVNIPVPLWVGDGGRRRRGPAGEWSFPVQAFEAKTGGENAHQPRRESEGLRPRSGTRPASKKSPNHRKLATPVPETDTGGGVENTQGRELTLSKELGKMAP